MLTLICVVMSLCIEYWCTVGIINNLIVDTSIGVVFV